MSSSSTLTVSSGSGTSSASTSPTLTSTSATLTSTSSTLTSSTLTSSNPSLTPTPTTAPPPPPLPGPPYAPHTAQLGLTPSPIPDIPLCAALIAIFALGALANARFFSANRRRGVKFLFSIFLTAFCGVRVAALVLRIVWAVVAAHSHPNYGVGGVDAVRWEIAGQIFTAAGVLVLFVVNLVFAERVVRAYHPLFGWSLGVRWLFRGLFASAVAVLVMVVTVTVQMYYLKPAQRGTHEKDRRVQLFCVTFLAAYAFLPVPLMGLALTVPRRTRIDKFGEGSNASKFALLGFTTLVLSAGAIFRAVVAYDQRPADQPAWFHSKACYYCFNFALELVVVFTYALSRFDRRFHIPDGSYAPGHYSGTDYSTWAGDSMITTADCARGNKGGMKQGTSATAAATRAAAAAAEKTGGEDLETNMAEVKTPCMKNSRGGRRSERSSRSNRLGSLGSLGSLGKRASESNDIVREEDMAWMAKALRELYREA